MADFGLVKSFGIDNGELDGLGPQECFVLDYELAQIDDLLSDITIGFRKTVHVANRERISASCRDAGREFTLSWLPDDSSEAWLCLDVHGPRLK